jgi:ATP-dependent RNA helicase DeaD
VNIDLPYDEEDYVHRIGRTGRAGRSGKAVSLVSGREVFLLQRIQRYAKVRIERHIVPSREEVEGKRADSHFEVLRATLEEGSYKNHETTIQRLLDAGHAPTEISSALMHLWVGESSRESEEILEDRPRKEKPERGARDRGADGERRERRGQEREFMERGGGEAPRKFERRERPGGRPFDEGGRRGSGGESSPHHTKMFINVGAMDGASPREIAGAIYRTCELPEGAVGRIDIYAKCSFVLMQNDFVELVMERIGASKLHGRTLRMDVAR